MRQLLPPLSFLYMAVATCAITWAQSGLQPVDSNGVPPATTTPSMVPINPYNNQSGVYPPSSQFDPYASTTTAPPSLGYTAPNAYGAAVAPTATYGYPGYAAPAYTGAPSSVPINTTPPGAIPGAVSAPVPGVYPNSTSPYVQPGYPGQPPASVYPNSAFGATPPPPTLGNPYPYGNPNPYPYGNANPYAYPPANPSYPGAPNSYTNTWNPYGTMFDSTASYQEVIRFCQGGRFRYSYIYGNDDPNALQINDFDWAVAFAWPGFFGCNQPLYIMPSFSLHLWDGPKAPSSADLPPTAYSAFLDTGYQSDPNRIWGGELGFRFGVFSDFNAYSSDSWRFGARAIGRLRTTPNCSIKLGVLYLDRLRIKLLPAGGVLWTPNPQTRFDIFFPEPKLAHACSAIWTTDTWWYLAGYYGGGSWTVQRTDGSAERIDINDYRVTLGIEWGRNDQLRAGRRIGFFEVGYVFERELLYERSSSDNIRPQDAFMFRLGVGY